MAVCANHFDWLNVNSRERNEAENENEIDTKHTLTQNHSIKNGVCVYVVLSRLYFCTVFVRLFCSLICFGGSRAKRNSNNTNEQQHHHQLDGGILRHEVIPSGKSRVRSLI